MEIDDDEPQAATATAEENEDIVEVAPAPASATAHPPATTTTPFATTPRKLYDLPELAERYIAVRSTVEDVVYRDPSQFSLKPPCWKQWKANEYSKMADYLGLFDLVPLARELGKPVEEVYHMYHGVVTNPLRRAAGAKNKGKQSMQGWFQLYNKYGTPTRVWGIEGIRGELDDITDQTVHLILQKSGSKCEVKLEDLTEDDFEWIQENISLRDRQILSGLAAGKDVKYPKTDDGLPPYKKSLKRKTSPEPATPNKQARLAETGNATAPAKMRSTPSAFESTLQASRIVANETPTGPSNVSEPFVAIDAPTPSKAPTSAPNVRQPSVAVDAPTPSKAPPANGPTTPMATKMITLPISSPKQFDYRPWTAAAIIARFDKISTGCVVLIQRKTLRELTVPLSALSRGDRDWINDLKKQDILSVQHMKLLKTNGGPDHEFRKWTNQAIAARYVFASRLKAHVELEEQCEQRMTTISFQDLNNEDKAWIKKHVCLYDKRTLSDIEAKAAAEAAKAAKAAEIAQGSRESTVHRDADGDYVVDDSISDKDAEYDSEGSDVVRTQKRSRTRAPGPAASQSFELADRSMSVAASEGIEVAGSTFSAQHLAVRAASKAPDAIMANNVAGQGPDAIMADDPAPLGQDTTMADDTAPPGASESQSQSQSEAGDEDGSDTAIIEPYEVITGAPIRQWTDFNLIGNLVGIAERTAFVRMERGGDIERLSMERWSRKDVEWVKDYLVSDQRKILSGKAKVGGVA